MASTEEDLTVDEVILQVFEEQGETFHFPVTTQKEARAFVKALYGKGLSYDSLSREVKEIEQNFTAWRKGISRPGIGNRIIERINKPLQELLLSDGEEEDGYDVADWDEASSSAVNRNDQEKVSGKVNGNSTGIDKNRKPAEKDVVDGEFPKPDDQSSVADSEDHKDKEREEEEDRKSCCREEKQSRNSAPESEEIRDVIDEKEARSVRNKEKENIDLEKEEKKADATSVIANKGIQSASLEKENETHGDLNDTNVLNSDAILGVAEEADEKQDANEASGDKVPDDCLDVWEKEETPNNSTVEMLETAAFSEQPTTCGEASLERKEDLPSNDDLEVKQEIEEQLEQLEDVDKPCLNLSRESEEKTQSECSDATDQCGLKTDVIEQKMAFDFFHGQKDNLNRTEEEEEEDEEGEELCETEEEKQNDVKQVDELVDTAASAEKTNAETGDLLNTTVGVGSVIDKNSDASLQNQDEKVEEKKSQSSSSLLNFDDDEAVESDSSPTKPDSQTEVSTYVAGRDRIDAHVDLESYDSDYDEAGVCESASSDPFNDSTSTAVVPDHDLCETGGAETPCTTRGERRGRRQTNGQHRHDGPGYVYVFTDSLIDAVVHRVKVGASRFPQKKLEQSQLFNIDMKLLSAVQVNHRRTAVAQIIERLSEFSISRTASWFRGPLDTIINVLMETAQDFPFNHPE